MNNIIVDRYGHKRYYKNGLLHREDGPAVELKGGSIIWCLNGLKHRLDGPAIISHNGEVAWYYKDQKINCYSQKEFEKTIKLKAFW